MYTKRIKTPLIAAASGLLFWAAAASAHHGWAWTESEQTEMTGTITEIFIGPPHPRLMINTTEGTWQVDLGNPRQTQEAGSVEGEASVGDTVLIRGHRSAKEEERIIKAVRATIKDKQYTFYPKLVRED